MLKLMILCSNLNTAQKITNKIVASIENIRIIGIATNLDEAKSIIIEDEPELILTTNAGLINFIKEKLVMYSPGIILISNVDEKKDYYYKDFLIVNYNLDFKTISEKISNFVKEDFNISKKEKVIKTLTSLGFDFKLSGTNYLMDSILYANSYKGSYSFETIYYDIYSYVAKINNTNSDIIKWAVARSINYLYDKGDKTTYNKIEKYFGVIYPERLTPKFTINFIANKIS